MHPTLPKVRPATLDRLARTARPARVALLAVLVAGLAGCGGAGTPSTAGVPSTGSTATGANSTAPGTPAAGPAGMDAMKERMPADATHGAMPVPAIGFSADLARWAADLYAASRAGGGGAAVDLRAKAEKWGPAPKELQAAFRVPTAYSAMLDESPILVGHDGARGMVVAGVAAGFDPGAATAALEERWRLARVSRMEGDGVVMENYFASEKDVEYAFVTVLHETKTGRGLVGFLPAEVARREMGGPQGS